MIGKKSVAIFELVLLIGMSFSFAYLIGETNDLYQGVRHESKFVKISRAMLLSWLSKGLVSAQAIWTCPINNNGTICQEYVSDVCEENCQEACLYGPAEDFAICELGICYDLFSGSCQPNTPHAACTEADGVWYPADESPGVCNVGCCLSYPPDNTQAQYINEQQCNYYSSSTGIPTEWTNVANEVECLLMATTQNEGACVLNPDPGETLNNCEFTTQSACVSLGGDFYEGTLCTNEELNTICDPTQENSCKEGKDEVYYVDSCGNFANVWDSTKGASYWQNVEEPDELCELSQGTNPFGNQNSCGNCEYLLGSKCGEDTEDIANPGDYICRNLNCAEDEWGNERKHGESWCAFDGQIGVVNDGSSNSERSIDIPGSRNYKRTCIEGEIRTESCADYRNELCVENRDEDVGFSSAACRINNWQQCLAANGDILSLNLCETKTDCTLKKTDIDDFEFDLCVPKHPPGFDLGAEYGGEIGETICGFASQTCTYVEEKKIDFGGIFSGDVITWKCEVNCACKTQAFTESMNNLCMSLGDCGGQVNVEGEYTSAGYSVTNAPNVGSNYISSLRNYANDVDGQIVEQLSAGELAAIFGVSESTFENDAEFAEFLGLFGMGAIGIATAYTMLVNGVTFSMLTSVGTGAATLPGMGSFGAGAMGAAAGAAIGYLVAELFGLQGDAVLIVVITGAITGLVVGLIYLQGTGGFAAAAGPFLFWVIVIVLIVALILSLLGIGEVRYIEVGFSCLPWQPPLGGTDCSKCDDDSVRPCSKYKCESLGQTCEFINEGSEDALCYDSAPNDVSAPRINIWEEVIGEGFEYVGAQENVGVRIESSESEDGCIQEITQVNFGIEIDEPAQCKVFDEHTSTYEDMNEYFSGSNLYKYNHQRLQEMPPLSELGVPGVDPERRGEFDLFIRCQDGNGNSNINEYVVNFCVSPANDITAPIINQFIPESPGYVALGITEKPLQLYTNEPADCRWASTDMDYFSMEENTFCENGIEQGTPNGWLCNTLLDVPEGENEEIDYYFRCLDKPWLSGDADPYNDGNRTVNTQSTIYQIIRTTEELIIENIIPIDGTIISVGGEPVALDVEIHTSGGLDGNADCALSFNGPDYYSPFFETGGDTHSQHLGTVFAGEHTIDFRCTDEAGNVATANTNFIIEVDDDGPIVTRVYDGGGTLTVITDEPAQCSYEHNSCSFSFEDGTLMSGENLVHTTSFELGLTYYIKCRDVYENTGSCLAVTGGY